MGKVKVFKVKGEKKKREEKSENWFCFLYYVCDVFYCFGQLKQYVIINEVVLFVIELNG